MAYTGPKLDLLVWGATGYTGKLVGEYLTRQYGARPSGFTWGVGGRSQEKLEALKGELAAIDANARDLPIVVGDALDEASITSVVRSTKVIITTAGPYAQYGNQLVAACAKEGTHYADLTGEVLWMRDMITKHFKEAEANKVKIVHTCGFDSIPSDMGTFMMVDWVKKNLNRKTRSVKMVFGDAKGGVSGGTIASLVGQVQKVEQGGSAVREMFYDPYLLLPEGVAKPGWDKGDGGLGYDSTTGSYTSPFVMAGINAKVVRRSNAQYGNGYGEPFQYQEVTGQKGVKGLFGSVLGTAISGAMGPLLRWGRTRNLLLKYLPKQGEGPSKELRDSGYFWGTAVATTAPEDEGEEPITVTGTIGSNLGDPGYKETAHMLAEAGLAMALDEEDCPPKYGVLTPATAMGGALLKRLRDTGMTFEVHPPECLKDKEGAAK